VTATKSWGPTPAEKVGREVDYQVAAPLKRKHPTGTERTIAQQRVRMEGWRQRRPGSNAKPTGKKKKNRLDTNRPSHGRTWHAVSYKKPVVDWAYGVLNDSQGTVEHYPGRRDHHCRDAHLSMSNDSLEQLHTEAIM
jgi:hypothetical protein